MNKPKTDPDGMSWEVTGSKSDSGPVLSESMILIHFQSVLLVKWTQMHTLIT